MKRRHSNSYSLAAVVEESYGRRPQAPPDVWSVGGTPLGGGRGGEGQMLGGDAFAHSVKRRMGEAWPCAPVTPTVQVVRG